MIQDRAIPDQKGIHLEFWHDYGSFLPGRAWRDFCFLHVGISWDAPLGMIEWSVCVLGLWNYGTIVYDDNTPMQVEMRRLAVAYSRTSEQERQEGIGGP